MAIIAKSGATHPLVAGGALPVPILLVNLNMRQAYNILAVLVLGLAAKTVLTLVYSLNEVFLSATEDFIIVRWGALLLFLAAWITVLIWSKRKVGLAFAVISWALGTLALIFLPSIPWPTQYLAYKHNYRQYNEMIANSGSSPKFVILKHVRQELDLSGAWYSWLIYDEADELNKAPDKRSHDWVTQHNGSIALGNDQPCKNHVTNIAKHVFYMVLDCTS